MEDFEMRLIDNTDIEDIKTVNSIRKEFGSAIKIEINGKTYLAIGAM